jgi:predicted outer membrane repeat protein
MRFKLVWIFALLVGLACAPRANAAGVVSTCNEAGLTAALAGGGTVTFTCSGMITLTATITISSNTTVDGSGQSVTISGGGAVGVFSVLMGVTVNLNNLTIASGNAGNFGHGGGVLNSGTLTVTNCTFSGNSAGDGGGVFNSGTLTVTNCAFSGNSARGDGGGIDNFPPSATTTVTNSTFSGNSAGDGGGIQVNDGTLTVTNSTFSGNSASSSGGGIGNEIAGAITVTNSTFSGNSASGGGGIDSVQATVTVTNSTFSGNSAVSGGGIENEFGTLTLYNTIVANSPSGGNCAGTIMDQGGNLSWPDVSCPPGPNQDPLFDPNGLQSNGGPTQTIALLPGSPAIDTAVAANCPMTDQRGVTRPQGVNCDKGAYELIEQSTPVGANVAVQLNGGDTAPGGVSITGSVTAAGITTLAPSSAGPASPAGFSLGNPPSYFTLTTTAAFTFPVTICFNYTGISFGSTPQLFHFEGGMWVNVTTSVDTVNRIICGSVTSFSPFALFQTTINDLIALVNSFNLPKGTADSLLDKLTNAQARIASGHLRAGCNRLSAFINDVETQSGKKLTPNQANQLIVAANGVRAGLRCSEDDENDGGE